MHTSMYRSVDRYHNTPGAVYLSLWLLVGKQGDAPGWSMTS